MSNHPGGREWSQQLLERDPPSFTIQPHVILLRGDVPYQHQAEAVEQAFRMVELCAKSFQRAARQLANIRLIRAKTARTKRRERMKTIQGVRVA